MIAFTIIIAILFLVGLKSQDYRPFDKDKVVVLKPFLALGIVLSHLSSYSIYLHDFQRWGSLIVGIFFFISGYGLSYSLHYKVGYIRNFFLHRIAKALLLPYMGALLFYFVLNGNWSDYSFFDHISRVSGPSLIPNDWFVFALVYCYMFFYYFRIHFTYIFNSYSKYWHTCRTSFARCIYSRDGIWTQLVGLHYGICRWSLLSELGIGHSTDNIKQEGLYCQ